jgi:hypothetical protein
VRSSFALGRPIGPNEAALLAIRVVGAVTWLRLITIFWFAPQHIAGMREIATASPLLLIVGCL